MSGYPLISTAWIFPSARRSRTRGSLLPHWLAPWSLPLIFVGEFVDS